MHPTLLHFLPSHYNEKVRWALDYKGIAHHRRTLLPGFHMRQARRLTGQTMLPILILNGQAINDSTRIIAALEQAFPTPALYPENAADRARALELEDYFDEEWGPHLRRTFFCLAMPHSRFFASQSDAAHGVLTRLAYRTAFPLLMAMLIRKRTGHWKLQHSDFEASDRKVEEGMQRLEREIRPSGYLVGECFTVADLTAAAMLSSWIRPPQFPHPGGRPRPAEIENYRRALIERPGGRWAMGIYRRHRGSWVQAPAGAKGAIGVQSNSEGLRVHMP